MHCSCLLPALHSALLPSSFLHPAAQPPPVLWQELLHFPGKCPGRSRLPGRFTISLAHTIPSATVSVSLTMFSASMGRPELYLPFLPRYRGNRSGTKVPRSIPSTASLTYDSPFSSTSCVKSAENSVPFKDFTAFAKFFDLYSVGESGVQPAGNAKGCSPD